MSVELAGLGNALMDALVVVESETVLSSLSLDRGTTHMVDHADWERAFSSVSNLEVTYDSGGSCANTVATVGLLGGGAMFCGQVGKDSLGAMYGDKLIETCGQHALQVTDSAATGKCLSIISKADAERTMVTDLGAATGLAELGGFNDVLKEVKIGHFEGYMLVDPTSRALVVNAMRMVRQGGGLVSLDVNDPFVIGAMGEALAQILKEEVDIVFLNADEARSLTGLEPDGAVQKVADDYGVRTTVVKRGRDGSLVKHDGTLYEIQAQTVHAVDTTGAGDAYAGGFLFGMLRGWPVERCGALASAVAALTVSQVGAVVKDRAALHRILGSV